VTRLCDDEWRTRANDLPRLPEDDLDPTRVGIAGEILSALGRLDGCEVDDAALDLGDRFLGDHDDVPLLEAANARSPDEERAEIVTLLELGDPAQRDDAELAPHGRPVTRNPAWAL
jgi:hypothetical protein